MLAVTRHAVFPLSRWLLYDSAGRNSHVNSTSSHTPSKTTEGFKNKAFLVMHHDIELSTSASERDFAVFPLYKRGLLAWSVSEHRLQSIEVLSINESYGFSSKTWLRSINLLPLCCHLTTTVITLDHSKGLLYVSYCSFAPFLPSIKQWFRGLDVVVHTCNPICVGSVGRRIKVWVQP
jgi:hypothetical protein